MRQGEAQSDLSAADIRRFGAIHRSDLTVRARALEGQGRHYTVHFPFEEIQASRPLRRGPLYDRLLTRGAVMGEKAGWERPLWFAPSGVEPVERPSFGVQPWMPHVAAEHRAAREGCVVFDMSSFSKALVVGRDAERVLDRLAVNDMAIAPGRVMHTLMLNRRGGIECDMTAARLSERAFYLVTGTAQATRDFGLIRAGIGAGDNAELVDVTSGFAVLAVMGPRARNLLQPMTEGDLSASAFPYAQVRQLMIAGAPVRVMRVSFVGELGFELHVPTEYAATVYDALRLAGVRDAGYRALDSLRLEKANRACGLDIGPDDSPFEAGIGYVFSQKKMSSFVGRGALEKQLGLPLRRRLVTITLYQPDVLLLGRETIYRNGERAGFLRSGGFGHTIGKPIGLGYVETPDGVSDEVLASGTYELEVATRRYPAALHIAPLYDPAGARMRG